MLQVHEGKADYKNSSHFFPNFINVIYSLVKAPLRFFIEFDKITLKFKTRAGTILGKQTK